MGMYYNFICQFEAKEEFRKQLGEVEFRRDWEEFDLPIIKEALKLERFNNIEINSIYGDRFEIDVDINYGFEEIYFFFEKVLPIISNKIYFAIGQGDNDDNWRNFLKE